MKHTINWLSSMRGVAVFLVFVSHLNLLHMPYSIHFALGRIGVVMFFLMSGYLALSARKKRSSIQYMLNRFMRIYPIYVLMLLITFVVNGMNDISIRALLINFTAFQSLFGVNDIIGASWMLPIMISFFIIISLIDSDNYFSINFRGKSSNILKIIFICSGLLSTIFGFFRFFTGIPFPTAFFLLMMVAFLGILYRGLDDSFIMSKESHYYIFWFEVILIVSCLLSYKNLWFTYIASYNLGILLSIMLCKKKFYSSFFNHLGQVGMTFFLGAKIPMIILNRYFDINFDLNYMSRSIGCLVEFVCAYLLAYIVTKYIETPLLDSSKKLIDENI